MSFYQQVNHSNTTNCTEWFQRENICLEKGLELQTYIFYTCSKWVLFDIYIWQGKRHPFRFCFVTKMHIFCRGEIYQQWKCTILVVVYFDHRFGAVHSKLWAKLLVKLLAYFLWVKIQAVLLPCEDWVTLSK